MTTVDNNSETSSDESSTSDDNDTKTNGDNYTNKKTWTCLNCEFAQNNISESVCKMCKKLPPMAAPDSIQTNQLPPIPHNNIGGLYQNGNNIPFFRYNVCYMYNNI